MADRSLRDLAKCMNTEQNLHAFGVPITDHSLLKMQVAKSATLYELDSDSKALAARPWRNSPKYFTTVHITTLAMVKMNIHAKQGGSIEIMGMLIGKIVRDSFIVMDVYSLPVEGTETRVNAQNEAYEYMVQYLDSLREVKPKDSIVGWYHSHPGYGCWLSGIDVATQSLNQNFQDPYLAIVIDPIQTMKTGKVEIGAFRTYPVGYVEEQRSNTRESDPGNKDSMAKHNKQDMGAHSKQYYSLNINLFKGPHDDEIISSILKESWQTRLAPSRQSREEYERSVKERISEVMRHMADCDYSNQTRHASRFNRLFERVATSQIHSGIRFDRQMDHDESSMYNEGVMEKRINGSESKESIEENVLDNDDDDDDDGDDDGGDDDDIADDDDDDFAGDDDDDLADDLDQEKRLDVIPDVMPSKTNNGMECVIEEHAVADENSSVEESQGAFMNQKFSNSKTTLQSSGENDELSIGPASPIDVGQFDDMCSVDEAEHRVSSNIESSRKGTKRNLRTSSEESKSGVVLDPSFNKNKKRYAVADNGSAVDNELKHKLQTLQLEFRDYQKEVARIGYAELTGLIGKRAQRRVFGGGG